MFWGLMSKIQDIDKYSFSSSDELLLDANIWLRVYGPQADVGNYQTRTYSMALRKILTAKSRLHLDVLVLSEFINRWARLAYNRLPAEQRPGDFKAYRNGALFKPVASSISVVVRQILEHCRRIELGFETIDVTAILSDDALGHSDFTDIMLAQLCKNRKLKFITHDADFKGFDIPLLTANQNLLSSSCV